MKSTNVLKVGLRCAADLERLRNIGYRKARQEFIARGLASAARARKTGKYVSAERVIGKLARELVRAKRREEDYQ